MAGLGPTYGRGAMTNHWIDLQNSDVIFIMGGNPAENHPASFTWIHKAMDRGAKLIVVDPRRTRSAAKAHLYAPIRPGTDIVFWGGLISYAIQNELYNEEYVKMYTNALTLVNPDYQSPAELDGLFSGYNVEKRSYDTATWQYQTAVVKATVKEKDAAGNEVEVEKEVTVPAQAAGLDDPACVFAHLKKQYERYTPEMVERICGTPKDKFLEVAQTYCATGARDKAGTILYAMGQTQHTVGSQNVRALAMLQLLLGNIGIPGGGVGALRGESNVQGSTDMAVLYQDLPGYLGCPTDKQPDLAAYVKKFDTTSYWSNGPRFIVDQLKAWYGPAATVENDYAYSYLPKTSGNYSWIPMFEAMYAGKIKGLLAMGQNPAVGGPNSRLERKALEKLEWMVIMELFETETAGFWHAPGIDPTSIQTEVFLLPAADAMEKAGSIVTSGRLIQWRPKVAESPGDAQEDIWILDRLCRALKQVYQSSGDPKDRPILDLVWDYGEPPNAEAIAREINGYALDNIVDKDGKVLLEKGKILPGFATIASAANYDAIACGVWIYSGYFAPADDGTGVSMPACKRRGTKDPGDMGTYPFWGFAWPANRHILYNRASCDAAGNPWNSDKKLIWWDPNADSGTKDPEGNPILGKWVGSDVPDFPPTKKPDAPANPAGTGLAAQAGTDPFLMKADGKGWLLAPKGMNDGPLPEHYEPVEGPIANPMSGTQNNPVIKIWDTDADQEVGDRLGTVDQFPYVATTYRVTEHWQAGAMSRTLPWLAETQPNMFLELSEALAQEKGIGNGDQVTVTSARGQIKAVAVVTKRFQPLTVDGKVIHHVGMPWHYGWAGIASGDSANVLTPHVGDANTTIPEYKAFLVNVEKA